MKRETKQLILRLLAKNDLMSIATVRPDGYPQATTVTYASDGLAIYFVCDGDCQKVKNLASSNKVSLTVNREEKNWNRIQGLSVGGTAEVLVRPAETRRALALLSRKFPEMARLSPEDLAQMVVVKVTPQIISVIDYTKGFGHTELIEVGRRARPRTNRSSRAMPAAP